MKLITLYICRLDERKRRKDFILDRNLLHQNSFEKDLSQEENSLCRKYDAFMRFLSKEEHEDFVKTIVSEHRIMNRIQALQVCHFHKSFPSNIIFSPSFEKGKEKNKCSLFFCIIFVTANYE